MKKAFKYLGRIILAVVILLVVVIVLLYLPPVQNFLRQKAVNYVSSHYGLDVHVGHFRLRFPLKLELDDVYAGRTPTDTLLYAGRLRLNVGLRGIFKSELSVNELSLSKARFNMTNDTTGLRLQANLDALSLRSRKVNLKEKIAEVDYIGLDSGYLALTPGKDSLPDTTASKPFDWALMVGQIELNEINYQMSSPSLPYLGAGIGHALLAVGKVWIGKQQIEVDSLGVSGAWCRIEQGKENLQEEPAVQDTLQAASPWTIRAGALQLENSAFNMSSADGKKTQLMLSGIGIQLDSVYNRGLNVRAILRDLRAVQEGGVRLVEMKAKIALDSTETALRGAYIRTPNSRISLNAVADTSIQELLKEVPLKVKLDGQIGLADIVPYYPGIPAEIRKKTVSINTSVQLSRQRLWLEHLKMSMPGYFTVSGQGKLSRYMEMKNISGDITLNGNFSDIRFVKSFFQDAGIGIPLDLVLSARLHANQGDLSGDLRLCQGEGCLSLSGNYSPNREAYAGHIKMDRFPLGDFLAADTSGIGEVTADLKAEGRFFSWQKATGKIDAVISHFMFNRHDYQHITLDATLDRTRFTGTLSSHDPAVPLDLLFRGDSVGDAYAVDISGHIDQANLKALHFVPDSLSVGTRIDIHATASMPDNYSLHAVFDSLWMTDVQRTYQLGDMSLDMDSDQGKTRLKLMSGDLSLTFRSDTSLAGFAASLKNVAGEISRQVEEKDVNMEAVSKDLPDFSLDITGAQKNAIALFLKARNIGFRNLYADISSRKRSGVRIGIQVNVPYIGGVRLDSIHVGAWQTGKVFVFGLNAGSSAEAWKGLFNLNATGRIQGDRLRMELKQKNAAGNIGFDLGINLTMRDSSFAVSFFPVNPILGYSRWFVNVDNQVTVYKDGKINANLRMAYMNKLISIQSAGNEGDMRDRLKVEIAGIDLSSLSQLVPFMPELRGILNTDMMIYSQDDALGVQGNIDITELYYQRQRIGTLDLGLQYNGKNHLTNHTVHFELKIDSIRRAVLQGNFSTSENDKHLAIDADIPSFPLYVVNAFLPDNVLKLGGELKGQVHLKGTMDDPQLTGNLNFDKGTADVVMLGTVFGLDSSPLQIENGKIVFNHYRFIAPNNSDLILDGSIQLTPFDKMGMDITAKAQNFEVVNVAKNETSLIYGKAYTDIDARLNGEFSSLSVTGNINLLNQTAITYTLRSSDPELVDKSADLVRFVSFRDTTLNEADDLTNRVKMSYFSLRMMIEIGDQVSATVELSEDGSNNVSIQGGGNLVLSMNPESGLILSGKYILSGGTVVYNIPIAGKKVFNIRNGSYVEWTGNVSNPILNISASESVKATVEDGDRNRLVTFDAIIRIQNTLNQPDITFDLSAPNDMVIQNQLATFSPEERTRQALNLLVYNTYTAPGAAKSGSTNVANNALYSFVENELNKYTKKAGITLGVDSYNTDENTVRRDFTYEFSKQLFNDRIRVKIGGRISTDNNEVQDSNIEDNLVDDISIEYVFTKKRNLYLKVFRHSNYESVLDGEVTQTGVGIVWRKNFQKLIDLFRGKKARHKE